MWFARHKPVVALMLVGAALAGYLIYRRRQAAAAAAAAATSPSGFPIADYPLTLNSPDGQQFGAGPNTGGWSSGPGSVAVATPIKSPPVGPIHKPPVVPPTIHLPGTPTSSGPVPRGIYWIKG